MVFRVRSSLQPADYCPAGGWGSRDTGSKPNSNARCPIADPRILTPFPVVHRLMQGGRHMRQRRFGWSNRESGGSASGAETGWRYAAGVLAACLILAGTAPAGSKGLLHIGGNKQLFIDDHVIESLSHARQILNPAMKHPANPLLKQDRPWEGHYIGLQRIIYDPDQGGYRMWYRTTGAFESQKGGRRSTPALSLGLERDRRESRPQQGGGGLRLPAIRRRAGLAPLLRHLPGTASIGRNPTWARWSSRAPATTTSCRPAPWSLSFETSAKPTPPSATRP